MTGVVVAWLVEGPAHYGLIRPDDGGENVFVHPSVVPRDPHELVVGERVEFRVLPPLHGPYQRATALRLLPPAGPRRFDP